MSNIFPVSEDVAAMHGSATLKAAQAAAALRESGVDVIDLSVGEPDFDTPEFIKEYAREGLAEHFTKYTPSAGLKMFRTAIVDFYGERFGANLEMNEIAAACGGKQALFNAACALLNRGDEVLIPSPYWVTFPEIVNFCGAKNVIIDTEPTDFILTADGVRDAITDRTKLLIVNSPNNPTGRVIPRAELEKIFAVCAERGVYVITDECYLFFVYGPAEVFSSAALPRQIRENICVAGSFSKTYAMTGWRSGYTIAPAEWTAAMIKLQSHSATHPTAFVQYACAKALNNAEASQRAVTEMLAEYELRRNWLIPALNGIDGIKCNMPEGAFYAFADVRELIGDRFPDSAAVADHLLSEAHVVVTDGTGFGSPGFLRISYATSMANLEKAVEKMTAALAG